MSILPKWEKMAINRKAAKRMKVNHWGRARKFIRAHREAATPLGNWKRAVINANWLSYPDIQNTWRAVDWYEGAVIFDIAGNNFRLVTICRFELETVYIDKILTHEEYDKGKWKERYAKTRQTQKG